jgi:2-octaprenyl-6-methoxyphenol hydroxylase
MSKRRDIVIAGGGMVGISLALQLAADLPANISIALVEGFPLPSDTGEQRPAYHPAFDARSTALSYSTRLIYQQLGLWHELEQWLCPIETIHVSSKGRFGSTLLRCQDYQWPALGAVVENAWLGRVLIEALRKQQRIELINPAKVVSAQALEDGTLLALEGDGPEALQAGLLVVADGAGSSLRQQLGVAVEEKSYRQSALIANVATARQHDACAYERFTDEGPLALLPLLGADARANRSALVWTLPPERAQHLSECDEAEFLVELQQRFGYRLGRLQHVGERHSYPLSLIQSEEQVRQGVVIMGNAAHALHPVAGQGFNLALRDVAALSVVLASACAQQELPGELAVLQRYQQRQRDDQERTVGFSDALPGLFMQSDPLLGLARDMALSGLDVLPLLKREFVRNAAGVTGMGAYARG